MAPPERHGPANAGGPLEAGTTDPSRQVLLTIPSRLEMLAVLDQLVQALVHQYDFDEDAVNAVATSIIEAGTNAIQHGHHERAELPVHFRFLVEADRFEAWVEDSGRGFDLGAVLSTDPTGPEGLLNSRGRGIYIMRAMMDEVDFDIRDGHGVVVHLLKWRDANGAPPAPHA